MREAHGYNPAADGLKGTKSANHDQAARNREQLDQHGVLAINLMSSPGAGRTALLEATGDAMGDELRFAVIEGGLRTDTDARRIRAKGIPTIEVTTGAARPLDAHRVHDALHQLPLEELDVVFIENAGDRVSHAGFEFGQHFNVALLGVTEGDGHPAKYPAIFHAADLVLVSKVDLLDVVEDFDLGRVRTGMRALGRDTLVRTVAMRRHPWIGPWTDWLRQIVEMHRAALLRPATAPRALAALHA